MNTINKKGIVDFNDYYWEKIGKEYQNKKSVENVMNNLLDFGDLPEDITEFSELYQLLIRKYFKSKNQRIETENQDRNGILSEIMTCIYINQNFPMIQAGAKVSLFIGNDYDLALRTYRKKKDYDEYQIEVKTVNHKYIDRFPTLSIRYDEQFKKMIKDDKPVVDFIIVNSYDEKKHKLYNVGIISLNKIIKLHSLNQLRIESSKRKTENVNYGKEEKEDLYLKIPFSELSHFNNIKLLRKTKEKSA